MSNAELEDELEELRTRLAEAEETLRAIRAGEVDAVVVEGPGQPQIYTLRSASEPYRLLVEQMAQGALTVSGDGLILFCNECFAEMLDRPREQLLGERLKTHVAPEAWETLESILHGPREPGREVAMRDRHGNTVETYLSSAPLTLEDGEVRCLVVTDLSGQELRLRHSASVEATNDLIYALDARLAIRSWNRGAEALTGLAPGDAIGRNERELWPPDRRAELDRLVAQVRESGRAATVDAVRYRRDGTPADLIYTLTPLRGQGERLAGYSVVAHDITERKENEQRLEFLSAELDHRAKNLLAVVQATALLSARSADSLDDFLETFGARIQALSVAHGLLSANNWNGATVQDIATGVMAALEGDGGRIRTEGCPAVLRPRAAQDLAVALHELFINAVKYGSLSVPHGCVELDWRLDGDRLFIDWKERGGPPVAPPAREGLGSRVIQRGAGEYGKVDHRFGPAGVHCRFELPPDSLV